MRRFFIFALSTVLAILLHGVAALWLGWFNTRLAVYLAPEIQLGSLDITLTAPEPPQPAPVAIPEPVIEKPAADPVVVLPEPAPVPAPEAKKPEATPEPQPAPPAPAPRQPAAKPSASPMAPPTDEATVLNTSPKANFIIRPVYPLSARRRGEEGRVEVQVQVDARGNVTTAQVVRSSGYTSLDEAALRSVKRAHFSPARRGPTPVPATTKLAIIFRLTD
jgi:protein TonB